MKHFRQIVFYTFLVSTITITALAIWFFSDSPDQSQIAGAFPLDSYEVFSKGKKLTIYSLDSEKKDSDTEKFQRVSVTGKTEIKDKSFQDFIKRSFIKSLSDKKIKCFQPEQGLRVEDGKKSLDIVISFKCSSFRSYFKGEEKAYSMTEDAKVLFSKVIKDVDTERQKDD